MNLGSDDPGGHCSSLTGCQGYTIYSSGWTQYWASCDTGLTATDTSAVSFFLTILDRNGQECWYAGCSDDTGEICDWCGLHDGYPQLCCRVDWPSNHGNCDGLQYNSDIFGHQCVAYNRINLPTSDPSISPTSSSPTNDPSTLPTISRPASDPSISPTNLSPTNDPSTLPTSLSPTNDPSTSPTSSSPTNDPSTLPTSLQPTNDPSTSPTSSNPTSNPKPTSSPSTPPTIAPSTSPSTEPTTTEPTTSPSTGPSFDPQKSDQIDACEMPEGYENRCINCNVKNCIMTCDDCGFGKTSIDLASRCPGGQLEVIGGALVCPSHDDFLDALDAAIIYGDSGDMLALQGKCVDEWVLKDDIMSANCLTKSREIFEPTSESTESVFNGLIWSFGQFVDHDLDLIKETKVEVT